MEKMLIPTLAVCLLAACSTNPDGSINWANNPIERAAQKIIPVFLVLMPRWILLRMRVPKHQKRNPTTR